MYGADECTRKSLISPKNNCLGDLGANPRPSLDLGFFTYTIFGYDTICLSCVYSLALVELCAGD